MSERQACLNFDNWDARYFLSTPLSNHANPFSRSKRVQHEPRKQIDPLVFARDEESIAV